MRARRALVATSAGELVKRWLLQRRRSFAAATSSWKPVPPTRARRPHGRNVALISHCDFSGNSALHVYSIATELQGRGFRPAVIVPRNAKSVRDVGRPTFPVLTYRQARDGRLRFEDGHGPDLVHAFTPREHVRQFTLALAQAHDCPYVVHLEDNESALLGPQWDPVRAESFLDGAIGITVVIDRLLELAPAGIPSVVVWPGFDERILSPLRSRNEVRAQLNVDESTIIVAYTGNIHLSNLEDVRSLYTAVADVRRAGRPIVLVRTGWDFVPKSALPRLGDDVRALGWVAREHVPEILAAADVLVQPGTPGAFNDYRFPSKLPEFLASGRPVVLPRTNVGLELEDGVEALLLDRGDAPEIADKIDELAGDAKRRAAIGTAGRAFAMRKLRWERGGEAVEGLYRRIMPWPSS